MKPLLNSKNIIHGILLTLFIVFLQGCSSSANKTEKEALLETPHIKASTTSQSSDYSEVVVQGKPGSMVYVNGKKVGTIGTNGTAVITLDIPQNEQESIQTLVLKDESGNKSEPVVFTLTTQSTQTPDDNNSTDNGNDEATQEVDSNVSIDNAEQDVTSTDDKNISVVTPPVVKPTPEPTPPVANPTPTPTPTIVTLKSLKLTADETTLNKETNTTINVMATFSDNSTKDVSQNVTWSVTPNKALSIKSQNLKALQDGDITFQAKLGSTLSNVLHVNVFWEVNGYRLPSMPDEKLNNSTLLGIDSNNNGVRDDVERYLLEKYKNHHKIVSEIALQSGRAYQIALEDPSNAKETYKYISNALHCNMYFKSSANSYGDPILIDDYITDYEFKDIQLNTKERIKAYLDYNHNLSGSVLHLPGGLERKAQCDFNTSKLLKSEL